MLTVQGYVDDTTMAEDTTAGMQWLTDAWDVCSRLRSAGIQIDKHHCWKASGVHMNGACTVLIDENSLLDWTQTLHGHATLRQALTCRAGCSTTTIVCRSNLFICLTPTEVDMLLSPLFLTQCNCSNKCSVLVNHPASLSTLNWGAHLIEGQSTALGLLLYGKFS